MKSILAAAVALVALPATAFAATSERDVLSHYADLAHAVYEDSLIAARDLQGAVNQFTADPTEANLAERRGIRGGTLESPTSRARSIASATPSSTTGKAR